MAMFEGVSGRIAASVMARMNAEAEAEAVARLDPAAGSAALVIGFGPGVGIERLLGRPVGRVVGVDPSLVMNEIAADRNRDAIDAGRLELVPTVVADLPLEHGPFDGAIAVHTLQICRPFGPTAARLAALLKPGGRLIAITHAWAARKDYGDEDAFIGEVSGGLQAAGFERVHCALADAEKRTALLIEAVR